jgi:hypothetical protein
MSLAVLFLFCPQKRVNLMLKPMPKIAKPTKPTKPPKQSTLPVPKGTPKKTYTKPGFKKGGMVKGKKGC